MSPFRNLHPPGRRALGGLLSTAVSCGLLAMTIAASAGAKDSARPTWLTGKAFSQQLEQPTNLVCTDRPLGTMLENLATIQRVAIWLDRRIDPDRPLTLALRGEPLKTVIDQIGSQEQLGTSALGGVVYFGPPAAAAKLRTLSHLRHEAIKALPPARRKELINARSWQWPELATPRQLVEDLGRQGHVAVHGLERIPHDLWASRSLPPLPWADRLTLLLIQFDLTFELAADGHSIELVSVPENVVATRNSPANALGPDKIAVLARQFPDTVLRQEGDQVVAEGRVEDLEALLSGTTTRRTKTKTTTPGKQVYKLSTEQPLQPLVEELGKRLDLDFQFDREEIARRGIELEQTVTVKVENVSLDELIDAVLAPAGLEGHRQGRIVRVAPR